LRLALPTAGDGATYGAALAAIPHLSALDRRGLGLAVLLARTKEFALTIVTSPKGLTYKHFILTRFWFAKGPTGANATTSDVSQWFENRIKLFESYCLPSVVAQSCQEFTWMIYLDTRAPEQYVSKIRGLVSPYKNTEVVTVKAWGVPSIVPSMGDITVNTSEVLEDIVSRLAGETDWVLTSRLDTDDGLHRDFVRRLHECIGDPKEEFLNFPYGILFYRNRCYLYHHPRNAFISLFEPAKTLKTVICGPHERLNEVGPIRQLPPAPGFVQIVHGANVSNKVRGYRVPKSLALQGFEEIKVLLESPSDESNAELLLDSALWGPIQYGRDQLVNQVKAFRRYVARRGYTTSS
jgi:Putative rhamnosyl transferase